MVVKDISNNTMTNNDRFLSLNAQSIRYISIYFLFLTPNQQRRCHYLYLQTKKIELESYGIGIVPHSKGHFWQVHN